MAATLAANSIFSELKRRRVYRVALAYGVIASALVQVGGTILPIFHAPDWSQQAFILLVAVGFPAALILAWLFDITSEGIQRTPDAAPYTRRQLWLVAIAGTMLAAGAVAGYWAWHPWSSVESQRPAIPAELPNKSIAVLPFENASADSANAFFAVGVQDQILTTLSRVSDLTVISRASVEQYQTNKPRNAREIGQQLAVAYLLTGTVQRDANRLRVTAQLIDARKDAQIWAETYDKTAADVFAIQSELAQAIVNQLQAKLSPEQKAEMEDQPTHDMAAFESYARAKQIVDAYLEVADPGASLREAIALLEDATNRDSEFALAYCYLARAHNLLYFLTLDMTRVCDLQAEVALERALRRKPSSADAHLAMADHYFRVHRDIAKAEKELELARPGLPNSVPFFNLSGYINRRLGRWKEAEQDFAWAVKLDPRSPNAVNLLVDTYVLERRFPEAMQQYDRAIEGGLRTPIALIRRAALDFGATGDPATLQKALDDAPEVDVAGGETSWKVMLATTARDYDLAYRVLASSPRETFQDVDFSFYFPKPWYEGVIARAQGDRARARTAFIAARSNLQGRLEMKPNDPRTLAVIAQVDANLGDKARALEEAERAVNLMPVERDAYDGPLVLQGLAQVCTWTGEKDQAFEVLGRLLRLPGYISYGYLKMDPAWEPLRGDTRYEELLSSIAPKRQDSRS
jgi:TolB-like protein/Tfp pilus assembly protein PilF